ncbi:symmetrical bis(5'-nucleosyl)-tetraphosphatase [Thiotrichales bacterium 19S3-7]|nr:symmetrical bis(5'-nucleosyl)-tetraphosphatase [Thiotrichales bacterium 19S3-7]MCF6800839.1 symmetrical bis(5'-nucleosyl)-tetraphosphatase [Thiotrichales bacterium 19S3-11]
MSTYAIGDIQGCYSEFMALLELIQFNPNEDQLLLSGDLVNRGPQSLEVLRFIIKNQASINCVLGNHDLHLLAVAYGYIKQKSSDTLSAIIDAKDKVNLLEYLRHCPLYFNVQNYHLTHAGIPPFWSISDTAYYANEVSSALACEKQSHQLLKNLYGNKPDLWHDQLEGVDRLRCIINYLTRMRLCDHLGRLDLAFKGPIELIPEHLLPWFVIPNFKLEDPEVLLFGHWAALEGKTGVASVVALDYGCVWGGKLAAYQLEHKKFFYVNSKMRR